MEGAINPFKKKWTIQIFYTARDDSGRSFRATACYQLEAKDISSAIDYAKSQDWSGRDVKFGTIVAGWWERIP